MSFNSNIGKWLTFLFLVPLLGLISIALYAASVSGAGTTGTAILIAAGAWVVGALLGFIFAVPQSSGATAVPHTNSDASAPLIYHSNANLEQISDWLTKVLVGVGLVELTKLVGEVHKLLEFLAPTLGNRASSTAFALGVLVVYSVSGFMAIYLVTRVFLTPLFAETEQSLNKKISAAVKEAVSGVVPDAVEEAVSEVVQEATSGAVGAVQETVQETQQEQAEKDARAHGLALRQLTPDPGVAPPSQDELNTVIGEASEVARIFIFRWARMQRSENWESEETKPKMELTIPIFRALIYADPEERFHRNHAQLGYALKDQRQPDYPQAKDELSQAIAIRDRHEQQPLLLYELARAVCRIKLDEPPDAIVADLQVATRGGDYLRHALDAGKWLEVKTWLEAQSLSLDDLADEPGAIGDGSSA